MTSQTMHLYWIYPPSHSENATRGGNKIRSTYDVTTMVGGANSKTERFFTLRPYSYFPSKLYVQNET